ncbi:MAG TPA: outer membrane beta-barrel domain-containing protein [Sandaracinaceae bacterium LLY-WYZ-13_1]|nr:outer membrane beta-barrel domain-containing protein [Sandaracinaceae bacterium LLY-WYZ-13_1]
MKRALLAPIKLPVGTLAAMLSAALTLGLFGGGSVLAQDADMDFSGGEGEGGEDEGGADMDFGAEGGTEGEGGGADMDFTEGGEGSEDGGGGGLIDDLATTDEEIDTTTERTADTTEAREEIFAVQQIYALRINRVEVTPSFAQTLNDPFVSHPAISLGLNYWWTNVLAIGVNFLWYEGLETESDLNFFVRRSTRLAVPVSAYQFGAHLAFTYVPLYGKFAMFNEFIFQWDAYVVGGVGIMRTRPVPVVDPEVRNFDYDIRVAFNLGIGIRVFVSRWLAVFGEIRNYMYLEQLEALDVALGDRRTNPETWTQDDPAFTSNVTVHLGLTIFFPFEFEYRLPR